MRTGSLEYVAALLSVAALAGCASAPSREVPVGQIKTTEDFKREVDEVNKHLAVLGAATGFLNDESVSCACSGTVRPLGGPPPRDPGTIFKALQVLEAVDKATSAGKSIVVTPRGG
jgi:hypothetical protein